MLWRGCRASTGRAGHVTLGAVSRLWTRVNSPRPLVRPAATTFVMVTTERLSPMVVVLQTNEPWGDVLKRSSEETAKRAVAHMMESDRKLAAATVNGAIGEKLLELLARQDTVSLDDMIAAFQAVITARSASSAQGLITMQAEECISALRSLKTDPA